MIFFGLFYNIKYINNYKKYKYMMEKELNEVINDSIQNNLTEQTSCKKCGKSVNSENKPCKKCQKLSGEENKKCTKCEENKRKVAPLLIASFVFISFAVYGFISFVGYIMNLFTK